MLGRLRTFAVAVAVTAGTMMVPAPAYAAGELTVTAGIPSASTTRYNLKIKLKNNSGEPLTVNFKRLPDGSNTRVQIAPNGQRDKTVWLDCNTTSTLEFKYQVGEGPEQPPLQVGPIATGACDDPDKPDTDQTSEPDTGDDGGNGIDHIDEAVRILRDGGIVLAILLALGVVILILYVRARLRRDD